MKKKKWKPSRTLIQTGLIMWLIIQLVPLFLMFITSLKTNGQIATEPLGLPDPITFAHYVEIWGGSEYTKTPIYVYFFNSVMVTAGALGLLALVSMFAGYALARFQFKGYKGIYLLFIGLIAIPTQSLILPIFFLYDELNLLNKLWSVIPLYAAFCLPLSIVLMKTSFEGIPREIEEAAYVDGCEGFKTFWYVAMPLAKGTVATVIIVHLTYVWSELMYSTRLLVLPEVRTLSYAINSYKTSMYNSSLGTLYAGLTISSIPMLIVYFIFQKQITKGLMVGSIK